MLDIHFIIYDINVHNCTILDYNLYYYSFSGLVFSYCPQMY